MNSMRSLFSVPPRPFLPAHHSGTVSAGQLHRELSMGRGQMDPLPCSQTTLTTTPNNSQAFLRLPSMHTSADGCSSSTTTPRVHVHRTTFSLPTVLPSSPKTNAPPSLNVHTYKEPVSTAEYVLRCNLGQLRLKTVSFPAVRSCKRVAGASTNANSCCQLTVQKLGGEPLRRLCADDDAYLLQEEMMERVRNVQAELFHAGYIYFKPSLDDFRWYENKLWMEYFHNVFHYVNEETVRASKEEWKKRRFEEVKRSVIEHEGG
jgi:hypothetical protein